MPGPDGIYQDIVDALGEVFGRHPGRRAVHAKGVLCSGTFAATPEAAELTRAAHMQGQPVRATVRFSNASGNPDEPDYARDGRGMGVKLYLPDGSTTDIVATTLPVFVVRNTMDFLELTRLRKPDPATGQPDMERLGAWLAEHPEATAAIQAVLGTEPPASYAQCRYHAVHAFRLLDGVGGERFVRYRWEPEAGVATIPDEEARNRGPDYLREELLERMSSGPFAFTLFLQIAEPGDQTHDPTAKWPDDRRNVAAGRLEIDGPETTREQGDDVLVFDPTRVTDGIECSDDPILHARSRAYSVSVERRSGVKRGPEAPGGG